MRSPVKALVFAVAVAFITACATGSSLQEQLMVGQWEGEFEGFPLTLKYTESNISVVDMGMDMPYTLEGDKITFDVPGQGTMVFEVAIEGDTLTQTEVNTGQTFVLKRKM